MNEILELTRIARELVSESPALLDIYMDEVDHPTVSIRMPDGETEVFRPRRTSGSVYWFPSGKGGILSYFRVNAKDDPAGWKQDPGKPFKMVAVMVFAGGHIVKEVPFLVVPGRNPAKAIENTIRKNVAGIVGDYLAKHGGDIAERAEGVRKSLVDWYDKH